MIIPDAQTRHAALGKKRPIRKCWPATTPARASDSQTILYGAQAFSLQRLLESIADCKARGVYVALSIDGTKFSGQKLCDVPVPAGLFEHEEFVHVGRSMLKRFQMDGKSLENHVVRDRLLLTY